MHTVHGHYSSLLYFFALSVLSCNSLNGGMLTSVKILSWNVNGLRSYLRHDINGQMLSSLLKSRNVDILCLQETKLQEVHVFPIEDELRKAFSPDCRFYWSSSIARKGYSGTATIILNKNIEVNAVNFGNECEEAHSEGRMITIESTQFSLVNTYVPNSGDKLIRLGFRTSVWDALLHKYILELRRRRSGLPIIVTGDLNVAHTALDYFNFNDPASKKVAGTTPEEQASFQQHFLSAGFIDTFRAVYPNIRSYSFYSARKGEKGRLAQQGWRLDYVLTDGPYALETLPSLPYIEEQLNHPYSDHCPVGAEILL